MTRAPTLVVFCREPVAGRAKTRLIGARLSARGAAAFADAFINDTLAKARAIRPRRLVIAAAAEQPALSNPYFKRLARKYRAELVDQGRGDLGQRMARALGPFASDGALLLGTDVPTLSRAAIEKLMSMVARCRVVVAPSFDGGYYAIGVRGALPAVFDRMAWGGPRVFAETKRKLLRARVQYTVGPAWYDVDEFGDLAVLIEHLMILGIRRDASTHPCPATDALARRLGLL
ncbi:MAG: TIGR04282 family arsenosugar biosynthesis glycosyltransferase [Candidatus Binataceae bacterium]